MKLSKFTEAKKTLSPLITDVHYPLARFPEKVGTMYSLVLFKTCSEWY